MKKAKIKGRSVEAGGDEGRVFNKLSFHSLRHTYVSQLANAGIAPDVRQLLSGHADEKSHTVYTHTKLETLRTAIETLPRIA
jgi:integrase